MQKFLTIFQKMVAFLHINIRKFNVSLTNDLTVLLRFVGFEQPGPGEVITKLTSSSSTKQKIGF